MARGTSNGYRFYCDQVWEFAASRVPDLDYMATTFDYGQFFAEKRPVHVAGYALIDAAYGQAIEALEKAQRVERLREYLAQ